MTTIQDREYVERIEGRFHPTPLGTTVNECSWPSFADLFNATYTARMEDQLDEIEEGKLNWRNALRGFYDKFSVDLKTAEESIKNKKKASIPTDEICEKCGSRMVIKFGRFGQFLACANYPECKTRAKSAARKPKRKRRRRKTARRINRTIKQRKFRVCELCGREMALKKGRFGSFYGCTGYPECKNIRKIAKRRAKTVAPPVELDEICPKDGAKLVQPAGPFRRIYLLFELSEMRLHQARNARNCLPEMQRRRNRRQKIETRKSLLRLHELPEMRRCLSGTNRLPSRARNATRRSFWKRRRRKKARFAIAKPKVVIIKLRSAI